MTAESARTWMSRILLGFVLVTIGFAAGRRSAPRSTDDATTMRAMAAVPAEPVDQVVVYAAHMTFRCPECNQIEWFARELIETEFEQELADGRLDIRTVDYMRNSDFARKYNISSSTLVVARIEKGIEREYQRLDEVWAKVRNREEYFDYVRAAIQESLKYLDDADIRGDGS